MGRGLIGERELLEAVKDGLIVVRSSRNTKPYLGSSFYRYLSDKGGRNGY